jgi:hypothetical protein
VASHQTVKLTPGSHTSPDKGACTLELASMLAGETFSDNPQRVSPVIAAFLRTYNDVVDDESRQDLYAYASKVVDTRASDGVEIERDMHLREWGYQQMRQRHTLLPRWAIRLYHVYSKVVTGTYAVKTIEHPPNASTHAAVLELLDELVAIGAGTSNPGAPNVIAAAQPAAKVTAKI